MRDELDVALDNVLASYSGAEPSPDLAGRILQRAHKEPSSQHKGWMWTAALSLPVAAAMAFAFVLAGRMTLPKPPAVIASAPAVPTITTPEHSNQYETAVSVHRNIRNRTLAPNTARPLPPPLTKEELAIVTFVGQHPKEALEIAKEQKQPLNPLSQQSITISHLEIGSLTIPALNEEK